MKRIKIKISGNGTSLRKHLQILNATYTRINVGITSANEKGNYTILIVQSKDNYCGIRDCLADIRNEMKTFNEISLDGK